MYNTEVVKPEASAQIQTPIDLLTVVDQVKKGDPDAASALDKYLDTRMGRVFYGNNSSDDLLQIAKIKVFTGLDTFDPELTPNLAARPFNTNFNAWVSTIAMNVRNSEHRRTSRTKEVILHEGFIASLPQQTNPWKDSGDLFVQRFRDLIEKLIEKDYQKDVVMLLLDGKSEKEAAEELEIKLGSLKVRLSKARKILEEKMLFPAGYKRLKSFSQDGKTHLLLIRLINSGKIEGVKFLNLYYTTQEAVENYTENKANEHYGNKGLRNQGYKLLVDVAETSLEYRALLCTDFVVRGVDGRVYIDPEKLVEFRASRGPIKKDYKVPPEGCVPLAKLNLNCRQYSQLLMLLQGGLVPGIRQYNRWYVTRETVDQFLRPQSKQ